MVSYARYVLFFAAFLLLCLFLYFVIKKINNDKKSGTGRWGIFLSTFGFVFGSMGHLEATKPQLSNEAKILNTNMNSKLETEQRISFLKNYSSWKQLKQFWKKLNEKSFKKISEHSIQIGSGDSQQMFAQVEKIYQKWKEIPEKHLSGNEKKVLRTIFDARIKYIGGGFNHLYIMHRAPMPHETQEVRTLGDLEKKIALLGELKNKNSLSLEEWKSALDVVYEEIQKYVILKEYFTFSRFYQFKEEEQENSKPFEILNTLKEKYKQIISSKEALKEEKESAEKYLLMVNETEKAFKKLKSVFEELEK